MKFATKHPVIVLVLGLIGLLLPLATPTSHARADAVKLVGGGSSFAFLEVDAWRGETAKNPYNLSINYQSTGSSAGRLQYITGDLDFAVSDIPFRPDEEARLGASGRGAFVYVPVSAGGLAFMFNLTDLDGKRVTSLNLTREAVCKMFTVANFAWNDPEIANANPGLRLPNAPVQPIVRSDGSGTSYVLSEYCYTVARPIWDAFVSSLSNETSLDPTFLAGGATSNWPSGWGITQSANGADNVSAAVSNTANSITYNEAGYAAIYKLSVASVQNQAKIFTQPTEDAVSVALGYATGRSDGTFILDYDGPDPTAYFPSTYSYAIAQTTGFDPAKGAVLARFLCYSITKGQRKELLDQLQYARLSAPLVEIGKNNIAQIPGAPPWDQCRVDAAAPPPAPTTIPPVVTAAPSGGGSGGGATTSTVAGGGQTPAGGTAAPGSTLPPGSGGGGSGSANPGSATTTTVRVGSSSGAGSNGAAATPGAGTSTGATITSVDPVTGETTYSPADTIASESGCVDPITGLPADPSTCVSVVLGASETPTANASSGATVAPSAVQYNPTLKTSAPGPSLTKIVWWLVQGGSVCAIGVALAGVRRRVL